MPHRRRTKVTPEILTIKEEDMTKEEHARMIDEMRNTAHKIYERVARKIASGEPMELCEMGEYTDILKDLAEALKNLHKASHSEGAKVSADVL
jgi:hypothetical protein